LRADALDRLRKDAAGVGVEPFTAGVELQVDAVDGTHCGGERQGRAVADGAAREIDRLAGAALGRNARKFARRIVLEEPAEIRLLQQLVTDANTLSRVDADEEIEILRAESVHADRHLLKNRVAVAIGLQIGRNRRTNEADFPLFREI